MIKADPATPKDMEEFYGDKPPVTVRAVAVRLGGEIVAVAGVARGVAFCDIKEVDVPKITIWRHAREIMKILTKDRKTLMATPSENYPNAARFLERLGFRDEGGVYVWRS